MRNKQIPLLKDNVPEVNKNVRAINIMRRNPATLSTLASVEDIACMLRKGYAQFPVLNRSGQLVGSISSNFLIVLVEKEHWYSKSSQEYDASPEKNKE